MVNHCKLVAHAPPLDCEKRVAHPRSTSGTDVSIQLELLSCHTFRWCRVCVSECKYYCVDHNGYLTEQKRSHNIRIQSSMLFWLWLWLPILDRCLYCVRSTYCTMLALLFTHTVYILIHGIQSKYFVYTQSTVYSRCSTFFLLCDRDLDAFCKILCSTATIIQIEFTWEVPSPQILYSTVTITHSQTNTVRMRRDCRVA